MLFQTYEFIAFLLGTLIIYWLLAKRINLQNSFLLLASYFFYGFAHPLLILLLLTSTLVDFFAALLIERANRRKGLILFVSVTANLGLLALFKYYNFFVENVNTLLAHLGLDNLPLLAILLPAGISFYTFQTISYTVDVYRQKIAAERNFLDFALFISFFPQLVAGPIERAETMLPQFKSTRKLNFSQFESGIRLIIWGYFKKLVIADNVSILAFQVFKTADMPFPLIWVAALAFTVQIFADFSAYIDIACGVARLFGIELSTNFNFPYIAKSPADFWRRWHITLSNWIRDYIYIPLGSRLDN